MTRSLSPVLATICLLFASVVSSAEPVTQDSQPVQPYQHEGRKYPPILFATNVEDPDFINKVESFAAFEKVDDKSVGMPLGVRVLKGKRVKQDGTSFSSVMLSATTLGLVPVVSNKEFKVYYDVFVQGNSIAQFTYQLDSTDVDHLWIGDNEVTKTSPDEAVFLEHSVSLFLKDIKDHKEIQAVFAEYWEYFGEE